MAKILLVDNDSEFLESRAEVLEKRGYPVVTAERLTSLRKGASLISPPKNSTLCFKRFGMHWSVSVGRQGERNTSRFSASLALL